MSDWSLNYIAALQARDAREQAHKQYIDAYTRLADRQASASAASPATITTSPPPHTSPKPGDPSADVPPQQRTSILSGPIRIASRSTPPTSPSPIQDDQQVSLRADLASTQKARAALAATLKDVEAQLAQLQAERKELMAQIAALSRAKNEAERKLRDRDSEIKGKASLVDQVQDEMVSLEMQLNLAEEKAERLAQENKDLVDRWMRKMGEEAERVNKESRWT